MRLKYTVKKPAVRTSYDIPDTWKQYPDTLQGAFGIVTMEYNEIKEDMLKRDFTSLLMNIGHLRMALKNLEMHIDE